MTVNDSTDNLSPIGQGGYAQVWSGNCTKFATTIAMKKVNYSLKFDEKDRKRRMAEVEALKNLRHDNIVELYDSFDTTTQGFPVRQHFFLINTF